MENSVQAKSEHWADIYAAKIVRERSSGKDKDQPFVCASGITPSGTVHIGNFREIISVELVVRALQDLSVPVRFIYSWDDYDVFRKVPANMPQQELLTQHLRQAITRVPDVIGSESSYAAHNEKALEKMLPLVGIFPEYLYQAERYQASMYAEGMRQALASRDIIRRQLNEHRSEDLAADWWPISFFCGECHRDNTSCQGWDGEWQVDYRCDDCDKTHSIDLRTCSEAKLPWRIDWPMRWAFEKVDFEPAGKDHHSEGGSFSTAQKTAKEVYNFEAPVTFQYDFVRIKGLGGKISSSTGEVISLDQALEVYQPEVLRYLFAGTRPNSEFAISFDLDVLKVYEDYDRCAESYYSPVKEGKAAKKQAKLRRIYELSQVTKPAEQQPYSIALRHLANLLQVNDGDIEAVKRFLAKTPEIGAVPEHSTAFFEQRARCAWNWIQNYAPEDFIFQIRKAGEALSADFQPSPAFSEMLPELRALISEQMQALEPKAFSSLFYELMQQHGCESSEVFPQIYQMLIGRADGPRLIPFLYAIGPQRLAELLQLK